MKKISTLLAFILLSAFLTAQTLTITNGSKEKELRIGSFFELELLLNEKKSDEKCCPDAFASGTLTKVSGDSLYFSLNRIVEIETRNGVNISSTIQSKRKEEFFERIFAKKDIFSLRNYKDSKRRKAARTRSSVGGVISILGIGSAVSALFVKDKVSRKRLLLGAGAQVVSGFIVGMSSVSKKYSFQEEDGDDKEIWRFND